jgi:hypothetical protein
MRKKYNSKKLLPKESREILIAIRCYARYLEQASRGQNPENHSQFLNACNILRDKHLSGLGMADLLLGGMKIFLKKSSNLEDNKNPKY